MSAASPSPHALDHGLGDWLAGPACDDIIYAGGEELQHDDLTGVSQVTMHIWGWFTLVALLGCSTC
jgi:hypothetical protein